MLHPEKECDLIPNPEPAQSFGRPGAQSECGHFGGLDIRPFGGISSSGAPSRYVSFYPYYVPSSYTEYYPKNFGRYYQPVSYVDSVTVEVEEPKRRIGCPVPKPIRWPLFIVLIVLAAYWYSRRR